MPAERIEHLVSRVGLPDDPKLRRAHLDGLNSGLQGWDEADVEARRPALEPWRGEFDKGRACGLNMSQRNGPRRRALQQGTRGTQHRIEVAQADKDRRAPPELP